jgi:hypothetical protein
VARIAARRRVAAAAEIIVSFTLRAWIGQGTTAQ